MQMLERFIRYILEREGVWFARMQEIADYAKIRTNKDIEQAAPANTKKNTPLSSSLLSFE